MKTRRKPAPVSCPICGEGGFPPQALWRHKAKCLANNGRAEHIRASIEEIEERHVAEPVNRLPLLSETRREPLAERQVRYCPCCAFDLERIK